MGIVKRFAPGKKSSRSGFLEMATANLSWQDILNNLTEKAKKDGLIRSIKNAKTIEAKVDKVIDSISIRNKLSTWISKCAESTYAKSGGTATKLRDEGNAKFRLHDNEGSIRLYSESVICSPVRILKIRKKNLTS